MGVDQLHKQVLFDGSSSRLLMCKTSAVDILFGTFTHQVPKSRKMKIILNPITDYQFSSCLRP